MIPSRNHPTYVSLNKVRLITKTVSCSKYLNNDNRLKLARAMLSHQVPATRRLQSDNALAAEVVAKLEFATSPQCLESRKPESLVVECDA